MARLGGVGEARAGILLTTRAIDWSINYPSVGTRVRVDPPPLVEYARRVRGKTATLAVLLACLATAPAAGAATFEVTRHNDPSPGRCKPNDCSLREAVLAANERGGRDVIVLPDAKPRYGLRRENTTPMVDEDGSLRGDLDITGKLVLRHPGRGKATIDANGIDRVLDVRAATVVSRIKLTGGDQPSEDAPRAAARGAFPGDGGGIIMHASLTLIRSAVVGNGGVRYGGGIESYPLQKGEVIDLVLRRSKVAGNENIDGVGGGIDALFTRLRIGRSKIVGNHAGNAGGGVSLFEASLRMNRTTVAQNTGETGAGGVYLTDASGTIKGSTISGNSTGSSSTGGGVDASGNGIVLRMVNSTVAGNRATFHGGGVVVSSGADLELNSVTIARNVADSDGTGGGDTGGLRTTSAGSTDVVNSIIALNLANSTPSDCDGFDTGGGNLVGNGNGCNVLGTPAAPDIIGANPRLGQLKRNGGPTKTLALKRGSPAIGKAVKSESPKRDQRGHRRDAHPDIGAFER
jgi:hypothetical protein